MRMAIDKMQPSNTILRSVIDWRQYDTTHIPPRFIKYNTRWSISPGKRLFNPSNCMWRIFTIYATNHIFTTICYGVVFAQWLTQWIYLLSLVALYFLEVMPAGEPFLGLCHHTGGGGVGIGMGEIVSTSIWKKLVGGITPPANLSAIPALMASWAHGQLRFSTEEPDQNKNEHDNI